ncbi:MAG: outer membrane protein assembly factor BamB [Francisella sp.]
MKKIQFFLCVILFSILVSSCSTSNVPPPTPLSKTPPKKTFVKVIWKQKTGNGNGGLANYNVAPFYANNTVFVPNQNGMLYALSINDGKVLWKSDIGSNLSSQPNVIANAVIVGSIKGILTAVDSQSGQILWQSDAPSSIVSQPTIYNNSIYLQTHDGSVSSFNARNGDKEWSVANNIPEIMLPGNSSPIILNNTVIVGNSYGTVLGFTIKNGEKTVNVPIAISHGESLADKMVDIVANPMLYDDYLIFASYQGSIVALDKDNGKMLWAKKSSIVENMAINNGVIYTTQDDSQLKAYDIHNGDIIWTQDILKWRKITAPIYYKGLIVVGDYQGYLHFFNSLNGEYLGRYKLTPKSRFFTYGISSQLVPAEKGIIVEDDSGNVYLVDAYSDKVIYDSVLSDYHIDNGKSVSKIYPVKKDKDSKNTTKAVKDKGKKVTVIIGDFSKGK